MVMKFVSARIYKLKDVKNERKMKGMKGYLCQRARGCYKKKNRDFYKSFSRKKPLNMHHSNCVSDT